jgi:UDP:flavonoid glycosyltransferase YjiC (YdhE family)
MAVFILTSSGTLGDHFPLLALGRALVERGHQVRYAGPLYLRQEIEDCGMEFRRARPEIDPGLVKSQPDDFDHWREERGGVLQAGRRKRTTELYDGLEIEHRLADLLEASRGADMLVSSILQPVGRMVSELLGLPWVTVCVVPWLFPTEGSSAAKGIALRDALAREKPIPKQFYERMDSLRHRLGLDPIPAGREPLHFEGPRILLASSPLFGEPPVSSDRELVQTGFWFHARPRWSGWKPPAEWVRLLELKPRPLVLAFSSQPVRDPEAVMDVHLAAARRLGRLLAAQSGWAGLDSPRFQEACRREEAISLPEGPQDWIFSQAGAVINHGGIGTIARALRAGAPLIVEPYGNDQFYNARQVVAMGAGAAVHPHRLTTEGLVRVLREKVLTDKAIARARELSASIEPADALEKACRQLETWRQD